jgi:hypothetical protein
MPLLMRTSIFALLRKVASNELTTRDEGNPQGIADIGGYNRHHRQRFHTEHAHSYTVRGSCGGG